MVPETFSCADLHMHSTWSDGTDSPKELLGKVMATGIDFFSVTDHDEFRGTRALLFQLKHLEQQDPGKKLPFFVSGTEFSCRDDQGKYHILGYAYDTKAPSIRKLMADVHDIRITKVTKRVQFLKDTYGFFFTDEELAALMRHHNPGKPHIANLMIRHGYAANKADAIRNYINHYHGPERRIRPEEAIEAVRGAGGIPVLAHGPFGDGEQDLDRGEMEKRVERLQEAGLMGVEAYYSSFRDEHRQMMLDIADCRGLLITAGSDYHGKNKIVVLGDTGPAPTKEINARLSPFFAETKARRGIYFV